MRYASPLVEAGEPIRLNKFLSNSGLCSRRTADQYIVAGRVKVNGVVISELGSQVLPTDQVMVDDKPVSLEAKVYVLLNKPKNCVTTLTDPEGRRTVMDLVHNACTERIYPIGRLEMCIRDRYTGEDNQKHRPVMIHRAPFGSMERFVAVLIEHTAGKFPLWLAPDQVVILPVSERFNDYAYAVSYTHLDVYKRQR